MKKLLTLFAFAVGGILCVNAANISGTNFEQFMLGTGEGAASVIGKDDGGNTEGDKYWKPDGYTGVANVMTGTKVVKEGQSYPAIHGTEESDEQYLFVNTSGGTLVRNISADGSAMNLKTITDGKLFFDSMVQFTATESLQGSSEEDKLIVWLKEEPIAAENLVEGGPTTTTNLVVRAAQIEGNGETGKVVDYEITSLEEGFVPGQWYRLTIVAYPDAFKYGEQVLPIPAFAVYVNGTRAEYNQSQSAIATGAGVTVDGSCTWLGNGIFPSLQLADSQEITSVAFEGYGYVDDLEFSTDLPSFAEAPTALTINWGEGIASIKVENLNLTEGNKEVYNNSAIAGSKGSHIVSGAGTYKISVMTTDDYYSYEITSDKIEPDGDGNYPVSAAVSLSIVAKKKMFQVGENQYFDTLAAAITAASGGTVKLCQDFAASDFGDDGMIISSTIILDLNGKTIENTNRDQAILANANMTIIDSIGGGNVVDNSSGVKSSAISVSEKFTVTLGSLNDKGVKVSGPAFGGKGNILIVRAEIEALEELEEGADKLEFAYADKIDQNSEITVSATTQGEYWVVAPKATEEPTKFTVTFDDGDAAEGEVSGMPSSKDVDALTTVTEPTAPTREHYEFAGWTLAGADYDFDAKVTGDITLVAKWTIKQYTVTFDDGDAAEGEVSGMPSSKDVDALTTVTKPADDPTRDGYTFLGWFLGNDAYNFETPVTSNITLVAQWKAPEIGGNAVAPEEVFNTANSETGIVYPSVPQVSPIENGPQTITFNGTTVNVPEYYTAELIEGTTTVKLTLNDNATPVIGATEASGNQEAIPAFAMEVKGENGEVVPNTIGIGVPNTNPNLWYGISASTSLTGFVPDSSTLQQGGKPLQLKITKGEGNVKFFKVYVTDIAPTTPQAK